MTTRREFIGAGAAILGASAAGASAAIKPADEKLDILFLGGTGFLGPHQINYALDRGHRVAMFNRGNRSGMFGTRVEELSGDRDANVGDGLKALEGKRTWDVVVDNSGYVPRHVRDSAELLKGRCGRYIYTSTVAVYDFEKQHHVDNSGPMHAAPEPPTEEVTGETYGPLKAECPPDPGFAVDWIDVRDLCHWLIRLAENDTPGVYNATAPGQVVSREHFMWALRLSATAKSTLHWPTRELIEELEYSTPMFYNPPYSIHADSSAAQAAGLTFRTFADTVRDTHEWWMSQSEERRANPRRWPSAEDEAAVMAQIGT
jgi:2'-hydroxyisoflavone reductase